MKFGELEFIRNKYSGLDGKTKVSFQQMNGDFTIVADQMGITIKGTLLNSITTHEELEDFAELISYAWKEHILLVPKIETSFSGH